MINTLPSPKTKQKSKRVGRGYGSGKGGHTVGRGTKGQKSRSGYSIPRPGFEGGQMPLSRRLPKLKGFTRGAFKAGVEKFELQLSVVASVIEGDVISLESLLEAGLIYPSSKKIMVKILFDQDIKKSLTVEGIPVTKSAQEAIEKAGGKVVS